MISPRVIKPIQLDQSSRLRTVNKTGDLQKNVSNEDTFVKKFESYYPLLGAILAFIIYWVFISSIFPLPLYEFSYKNIEKLSEISVTVSAIAIGFLGTNLKILISLEDKKIIIDLKNTVHYQRLIDFYKKAIYANFLTILISGVLLFLDLSSTNWLTENVLIPLWISVVIYSILSCFRIIILFGDLLTKYSQSNPPKNQFLIFYSFCRTVVEVLISLKIQKTFESKKPSLTLFFVVSQKI